MKRILMPALASLLLFACAKNKTETPVTPGTGGTGGTGTCNTTNITYTNTISGIISSGSCLNCHGSSPTAPFRLETYQQVKAKASEQRNNTSVLYGALAHQSGFTPMPQGQPKLSTCELAQIKAWIDAGLPQ